MRNLNIANSLFPGLNDQQGIMLCGYEWGWSKKDQEDDSESIENSNVNLAQCTFSNKSLRYGAKANGWRYDNRIVKWFDLWGHPLSRENLGTDFEKCIVQTNWCNTQNHKINESYYSKLTDKIQIDNFIYHIEHLKPSLILFFGSEQISILQDDKVLPRFVEHTGNAKCRPYSLQKDFSGIRFHIRFQDFEHCRVVCLPHPSSSRGLSDSYIALFKDELSPLIAEVKRLKGVPLSG